MKLIVFVLLASPCFCQDTWGGLRFGMTPAQVRAVLKDRPNKSRTEPENAELHTPEMFFIDVQDVIVGQHNGVAHLKFSDDRKLDLVSLDFTSLSTTRTEADGCFKGISGADLATQSLVLTDISKQILDLYGAPVSDSGTLPTSRELASYYSLGQSFKADVQNFPQGKRIWRTQGQVIEEMFGFPCGKMLLFISYTPQPNPGDWQPLTVVSSQPLPGVSRPGSNSAPNPVSPVDEHERTPETTNGGPSLRETLDWLKEKIPLGAVNYVTSVDEPAVPSAVGRKQRSSVAPTTKLVSSNEHAVVFSLDSCTGVFDFVTTITVGQQQGVNTIRYTVPLGVVTEAFVDHLENRGTFVSGDRSAYRLVLKSKSTAISVADFGINSQLPVTTTTNWFYLKFNDESLADRVMTAFKHAADLCGKKEVF